MAKDLIAYHLTAWFPNQQTFFGVVYNTEMETDRFFRAEKLPTGWKVQLMSETISREWTNPDLTLAIQVVSGNDISKICLWASIHDMIQGKEPIINAA
jgi:hypothetical protein